MKQPGLCFGIFGGTFLLWQTARNKFSRPADFVKNAFTFGLGMIVPFGLTFLALALTGAFSEFWFWTFTYARSYVTATPLAEGLRLLRVDFAQTFDLFAGFWLITAIGLPLALLNKTSVARLCWSSFYASARLREQQRDSIFARTIIF